MGKFPDAIHGRTVPNELSPKTDIEAEVVPRCQFVANIGTWAIQHGADGCGRLISNHDAHMHNLVVHQTFWYVRSKIGRVNQRQPSKQPNHDHQETQNQKKLIGPEYLILDATNIWGQGGLCWSHVFIVKPYYTNKNCNENVRNKGHQETSTHNNIMIGSTWG